MTLTTAVLLALLGNAQAQDRQVWSLEATDSSSGWVQYEGGGNWTEMGSVERATDEFDKVCYTTVETDAVLFALRGDTEEQLYADEKNNPKIFAAYEGEPVTLCFLFPAMADIPDDNGGFVVQAKSLDGTLLGVSPEFYICAGSIRQDASCDQKSQAENLATVFPHNPRLTIEGHLTFTDDTPATMTAFAVGEGTGDHYALEMIASDEHTATFQVPVIYMSPHFSYVAIDGEGGASTPFAFMDSPEMAVMYEDQVSHVSSGGAEPVRKDALGVDPHSLTLKVEGGVGYLAVRDDTPGRVHAYAQFVPKDGVPQTQGGVFDLQLHSTAGDIAVFTVPAHLLNDQLQYVVVDPEGAKASVRYDAAK